MKIILLIVNLIIFVNEKAVSVAAVRTDFTAGSYKVILDIFSMDLIAVISNSSNLITITAIINSIHALSEEDVG